MKTKWILFIALTLTAGCRTSQENPAAGRLWFDVDNAWDDDFTSGPSLEGDWVAVDRDIWMDQTGQTGRYLRQADEAYRAKDSFLAASMARRAGAQLKLEAARADGEEGLALQVAVRELYDLARNLEHGEKVGDRDMAETFAHAQYALALHHAEKAEEYIEEGGRKRVALALEAATTNLNHTWNWLNLKVPATQKDVLEKVRKQAEGLRAPKGPRPSWESIYAGLEDLQAALLYTGLQIHPVVDPEQ